MFAFVTAVKECHVEIPACLNNDVLSPRGTLPPPILTFSGGGGTRDDNQLILKQMLSVLIPCGIRVMEHPELQVCWS